MFKSYLVRNPCKQISLKSRILSDIIYILLTPYRKCSSSLSIHGELISENEVKRNKEKITTLCLMSQVPLYILKAKSNFTLFIFEYIYTCSDFKQMEHCH